MLFLEQFIGALALQPFLVYIVLAVLFSVVSFVKKTFSIGGIVFGNIVAFLTFVFGGLSSFLVLAVFFTI